MTQTFINEGKNEEKGEIKGQEEINHAAHAAADAFTANVWSDRHTDRAR